MAGPLLLRAESLEFGLFGFVKAHSTCNDGFLPDKSGQGIMPISEKSHCKAKICSKTH
jgi:hypothetical protein